MNKYYATIHRNSNTINYVDTLSYSVNAFIISKDPNTFIVEFHCTHSMNRVIRTSMRSILRRINSNIIPQVFDEHGNIVSIDETAEDKIEYQERLFDKMERRYFRHRRRDY